MDDKIIYGIQQVGVGVRDAKETMKWYANKLGADVLVFEDHEEATYMAPYMGGKARQKTAVLTINLHGGAGYEIWQHTGRTPLAPKVPILLGDLGINFITIKTRDAQKSFKALKAKGVKTITSPTAAPDGKAAFFIEDPYGNIIQVKEFHSWFSRKKTDVGGIYATTLGVSDIEKTRVLFSDILGYDEVVYDQTGQFDDLPKQRGQQGKMRRLLLKMKNVPTGGFSELFGESQIELIQVLDRQPVKIFEDRYWGDLGYIHLCFDIKNMPVLVKECKVKGFPFTVLSNPDFDMGNANGDWGYLEDPDGTLIEFVQVNKVMLLKKFNWFINLRNRNPRKPLPRLLVKAMGLNRVKL